MRERRNSGSHNTMTERVAALEMRGIDKSFAGNKVLDGVDITAHTGEELALVGENGAGKSTLMKILSGVHQPDAGEIFIGGEKVRFSNPADALSAGVAMIYQELSLSPHLTVAENIFLGREPVRLSALGVIDDRELNRLAEELLKEYGFNINPRTRLVRLSATDRQLGEITRAIDEARKVIVMDEPTSSLTSGEVEELFRLIRDLKARGLAVIYISHRLEELDEIADRLSILRDGRAVYSGVWGELSTDQMIRHMAGRELKEIFPPRNAVIGEVRLRVDNLSLPPKFESISFDVRAGEVVGIAGLAGAGRTELVEAIYGAHAAHSGEIQIDNQKVTQSSANQSVRRGVGLLTEDRKRTGLCPNLPMSTNITLANVGALIKGGRLQGKTEIEVTRNYIGKLNIKPPSPHKMVARLSGGNQQKSLLARWLFAGSKIFLLDEPTRGVDVAARSEIYREVNELAETGAAIVMVSSDLPELLGMADRILVMRRGHMVAEFDARKTSQEEILKYAALEEN